jgi:hypothetical protein
MGVYTPASFPSAITPGAVGNVIEPIGSPISEPPGRERATDPGDRAEPLREGDLLSRSEFLRRWQGQADLKFAERIEGVVHLMPSPVSVREHAHPDHRLAALLGLYEMSTPGVMAYANGTTLVDVDNDFQPDQALIILPEHGGRTRWEGSYLAGAPELVAEIAHTTAARDRGPNRNVYRRNGTLEYLVWRPAEGLFECLVFEDGQYVDQPLDAGVFRSRAFPGLWLNVAALLANDSATLRQTLDAGLQSPEHVEFVRRLATANRGPVDPSERPA